MCLPIPILILVRLSAKKTAHGYSSKVEGMLAAILAVVTPMLSSCIATMK